jgi:hypothetical protein
LYSSFKNEPPDTVASSWTSSISRTGPDPSVARNPFQPGRSLKSKEIFLSTDDTRGLSAIRDNAVDSSPYFKIFTLQDQHKAISFQSGYVDTTIRRFPPELLANYCFFSLVKSRRSKIWLKFYDLHQVHSIKIAKSLLYSWLTWSRRSKIG